MAADGKGVHGDRRLHEVALVVFPGLQAKVDELERGRQLSGKTLNGGAHLHNNTVPHVMGTALC